jgi:hypothetical protein
LIASVKGRYSRGINEGRAKNLSVGQGRKDIHHESGKKLIQESTLLFSSFDWHSFVTVLFPLPICCVAINSPSAAFVAQKKDTVKT